MTFSAEDILRQSAQWSALAVHYRRRGELFRPVAQSAHDRAMIIAGLVTQKCASMRIRPATSNWLRKFFRSVLRSELRSLKGRR